MLILSLLIAGFALLLIFVALLVAHRTPLPQLSHPGIFWWPGIGLLFFAPLLAVAPAYVSYNSCERDCDVLDGRATDKQYAEGVAEGYASCVKNSLLEVETNALEANADGGTLIVDDELKKARPGVEQVCVDLVVGTCISSCYSPDPIPGDGPVTL
jgi:hypothetical protein